jgi:UDPglucose 6-dehydrogenase
MNKKIGIIGDGYVGNTIKQIFSCLDLIIYDIKFYSDNEFKYTNSSTLLTNKFSKLKDCDFVFICVQTPEKEDGRCDTSIVVQSLQNLNELKFKGIAVIKSTVEPTFTKTANDLRLCDFDIVFAPEFAGENKYYSKHAFLSNCLASEFFIFGGPHRATSKLVSLYQTILGPEKKYIQCEDPTEAELMKYINNSFFAVKVGFCNEIYDLCLKLGVDYNKVRELWNLDPRNTPDFSCVFEDNRGFGGKCLPKDAKALASICCKFGVPSKIIDATISSNNELRKKNGTKTP